MSVALHILLPVHNRRATTARFVEALSWQTCRDFHLVLIDDGSTDGTADAVRAIWPAVDVLRGSGRWWWAGALEHGCEHLARAGVANDDVLLFINDDVAIDSSFLEHALAEFVGLRETLLLARQVDATTGAVIDCGGGIRADLTELRFSAAASPDEINCLPTRGLFLRWGDFRRTGGFRPRQLPHYLSDYEFTLRAASKGLKLRVARNATVGVETQRTGHALSNLFHERRAKRFRLLFSERFKDNPVTWSTFVRLTVPPARRPYLWFKIWANFLLTAARCVYVPISRAAMR
jgi:GT2 family glycosyltransferase